MPLNEIQQVKTKVKTKSPQILRFYVPHEQESLSSLLLDLRNKPAHREMLIYGVMWYFPQATSKKLKGLIFFQCVYAWHGGPYL